MGAEAMVDFPGWITAAGTVLMALTPLAGGAITYFVLRPVNRRIDGMKETAQLQHKDLVDRLAAQNAAQAAFETEVGVRLNQVETIFREHERFDVERFDDAREQLDSQIGGLRRDLTSAHDQQVGHLRQDIGLIAGRIDGLVGKVIETLAVLVGRKGASSSGD